MGNATTSSVIDDLMRTLGPQDHPAVSAASVVGGDPLTPSPHRLADSTSAAIASFGLQIAGVAEDAGCAPTEVTVRAEDAIDQLRASYLTTVSGVPAKHLVEDPALLGNNDFYRCRDGRWVFLITTYPGLRDAVCRVLNCPAYKDRIAEAAAHWDPFALEDAVCAAGGVCAVVRTTDEWRASVVGRHLIDRPVVEIEQIGESEPEPLIAAGQWPPLGGMKVVDLTLSLIHI